MAQVEKTVFISYRRADVYTALAVYETLKNQGYDVFFDYRSISSGDFEQVISSNVRARAHFLLILTPTALDRCNEPGDWLRREIELAIDEKRNIIPLFFKGFRFGASSKSGISKWLPFGKQDVLTGKLGNLTRYNGLNVHEDYFEEAMVRLRTEYLNKPLDTVLHPVSTEVRKVVKEEQEAADEALKQKEVAKEPVRVVEEKSVEKKELPKPAPSKPEKKRVPLPVPMKGIPWRRIGVFSGVLAAIALLFWGGINLGGNFLSSTPDSTRTPDPVAMQSSQSTSVNTPSPNKTLQSTVTITPSPTNASISATLTLGIGSTITGADGMTLLYVPAGEFTMGSEDGYDAEKPIHTVYLDAFWIDRTEVTNAMYEVCVADGGCNPPNNESSVNREVYYGHPEFDDYPVVYVTWNDANEYCSWADRRLPTEAEWEKAARGENANVYPWGDDAPDNTLLNFNSAVGDTTEVGKYPNGASPYGALDMAGNVWEWVEDWYGAYPDNADNNPDYGTTYRVQRGGSFHFNEIAVRSTFRLGVAPDVSIYEMGFRCAMDANSLTQTTSSSTSDPTWDNSIGTLFVQYGCTGCHGTPSMAGLNLSTYDGAISGGDSGPGVIPGDSGNSLLVSFLQTGEHYFQLTTEEIAQVVEWIDNGALEH